MVNDDESKEITQNQFTPNKLATKAIETYKSYKGLFQIFFVIIIVMIIPLIWQTKVSFNQIKLKHLCKKIYNFIINFKKGSTMCLCAHCCINILGHTMYANCSYRSHAYISISILWYNDFGRCHFHLFPRKT